jgi:hypothetical protein
MPTNRDIHDYIFACELALGVGHAGLAPLLGVSQRTLERWSGGVQAPMGLQLADLARCVHAKDPALAAEIAAASGQTLASLGIVAAVRAPTPTATPTPTPTQLVDLVVCATAEAMDVSPRVVRPFLRTAFARARELGLDVATVDTALAPVASASSKSGATKATSSKR